MVHGPLFAFGSVICATRKVGGLPYMKLRYWIGGGRLCRG